MAKKNFCALEYRKLNALRWQSEKDCGALCFKITPSGLIPVEDSSDCDLVVGRSAIYLYPSASPPTTCASRYKNLDQSSRSDDKFANEAFRLLFQIEEFEALNDDELLKLAEKSICQHYPLGRTVFRQNDQGDSLFIIAEGIFEIFMEPLRNGKAGDIVQELTVGHCFGEMSLLTGEPRSASVRAKTSGVVYEIKKAHLSDIMARNPVIVDVLSELMAVRQLAGKQQALFQALSTADNQAVVRSFADKITRFFNLAAASHPNSDSD